MSLRTPLLFGIAALAFAGAAHAQVSRVFVSANGNDANICSNIATPCRTLSGGITQVDAHGEVIVIDSGSYAGTTITKSVKIDVAAGAIAFSGQAMTVNPGPGGIVVLRGLTLKAATVSSGTAITHQSGILYVENTVVDGWLEGLVSESGAQILFVRGSVFRNQAANGLIVQTGSTANVAVDDSFFGNNGVAGSYTGVWIRGGKARVSNTVMTRNGIGAAVETGGVGTFQRCEFSSNTYGLYVGAAATGRVSQATVASNFYGLYNSGTLESFGNNVVRGNNTDTTGTISPVGLQ